MWCRYLHADTESRVSLVSLAPRQYTNGLYYTRTGKECKMGIKFANQEKVWSSASTDTCLFENYLSVVQRTLSTFITFWDKTTI